MEPLLAWAFLSVVVERIIEMIRDLVPALDNIDVNDFNIKKSLALGLGLLFSFGANLDFFIMVNIAFTIPYVGQIISAIFIMAGSNYIHDIISALNKTKQESDIIILDKKEVD